MGKIFQKREGFSELLHEFRFGFSIGTRIATCQTSASYVCADGFIPS